MYKTTDGGKSWDKVLYVNETTGAGDLVMDPASPNHLIAAMWDHRRWPWVFRSGGPGSGLHVPYDGGENWKQLSPEEGLPEGELGRMGLDFAKGNPKVVYAVVEATRSVMLRSDDRGDTWEVVNDTGARRPIAWRPFYFARVAVDPTNENRVHNLLDSLDVSEDGGEIRGGSDRSANRYETVSPGRGMNSDYLGQYPIPRRRRSNVLNDGFRSR